MLKHLFHYFLYFIVPIVLIGGVFYLGWGDKFFTPSPALVADAVLPIDFGLVSLRSAPRESIIKINNVSAGDVVISKIYSDCRCLRAFAVLSSGQIGPFDLPKDENERPINLTISPGDNLSLRVVFLPSNERLGESNQVVFVEAKKNGTLVKLPFKAVIVD